MKHRAATALVVILTAGMGLQAAGEERRPLDGVVAVVNDDVILASELGEEVAVRLYQLGPGAGDAKTFAAEVLTVMVETRLLIQDADARNIVVTNDDIKPYVDDELARIKSSFPSPAQFEAALAQYGMTEKTYTAQLRKNFRDQLKITRLTEEVLASKVEIDEGKLRAYYEQHHAAFAEPTLVTLREIAVAKQPTAASRGRLRAQLEAVRRQVLNGGDFAAAARVVAEAEGGEFNASFTFGAAETLPVLEDATARLAPGELSATVEAPGDFWLVRLVGEKDARREVQYLRVPIKLTAADEAAARAKVEEAAAALARGETFDAVAARFSENEETAREGGLVGAIAVANLERDLPEVARAVAALAPGEMSSIIERPEGFFIVRLDARQEGRDVSYDEAREEIKRALRVQQLSLEQKKYLLDLKTKAYIKTFE